MGALLTAGYPRVINAYRSFILLFIISKHRPICKPGIGGVVHTVQYIRCYAGWALANATASVLALFDAVIIIVCLLLSRSRWHSRLQKYKHQASVEKGEPIVRANGAITQTIQRRFVGKTTPTTTPPTTAATRTKCTTDQGRQKNKQTKNKDSTATVTVPWGLRRSPSDL